MARKRLIDTEALYYDSEIVEALGDRGLHLFIRLWAIAEDWGGYEPKYPDIAFRMGALLFNPDETKNFINKLVKMGKIIEYEINGKTYHWITNLLKHQPLNNPAPPILPLPKWISCVVKKYEKSGKKYAVYSSDASLIPVAYQYPTDKGGENNSNETKRNETNRNETKRIETIKTVLWDPEDEKKLRNMIIYGLGLPPEAIGVDVLLFELAGESSGKDNRFAWASDEINRHIETKKENNKLSQNNLKALEDILIKDFNLVKESQDFAVKMGALIKVSEKQKWPMAFAVEILKSEYQTLSPKT